MRARRAKADLFVSIHADAIANPDVSGSSVYVLSDRGASSEAARWLAERENAADLKGGIKLDDKDAGARQRAAGPVADREHLGEHGRGGQRAEVARPDRRGAQAARAAGGIRGAQVARYPLDAGRDRVHLEPRRRAQAVDAGASRQARQRHLRGNRAVLSGQCARRHAARGGAPQRRRRLAVELRKYIRIVGTAAIYSERGDAPSSVPFARNRPVPISAI